MVYVSNFMLCCDDDKDDVEDYIKMKLKLFEGFREEGVREEGVNNIEIYMRNKLRLGESDNLDKDNIIVCSIY